MTVVSILVENIKKKKNRNHRNHRLSRRSRKSVYTHFDSSDEKYIQKDIETEYAYDRQERFKLRLIELEEYRYMSFCAVMGELTTRSQHMEYDAYIDIIRETCPIIGLNRYEDSGLILLSDEVFNFTSLEEYENDYNGEEIMYNSQPFEEDKEFMYNKEDKSSDELSQKLNERLSSHQKNWSDSFKRILNDIFSC